MPDQIARPPLRGIGLTGIAELPCTMNIGRLQSINGIL
jgi:hypothetical protein